MDAFGRFPEPAYVGGDFLHRAGYISGPAGQSAFGKMAVAMVSFRDMQEHIVSIRRGSAFGEGQHSGRVSLQAGRFPSIWPR
jgi:hypothetical protein